MVIEGDMAFKVLLGASLAAFFAVAVYGQQQDQSVISQTCLGCVCEAASGCNTAVGCNGDICGPFHITWNYWSDSGKPTLNGESSSDYNAYSKCASDAYCSARTVQGYMARYAQDCDGNGQIDCDDFVRIHFLGGNGCSGALLPTFQNAYLNCYRNFPQ